MPYRVELRKKVEVCTDPQRRCYDGCFFSSEWVWEDWWTPGTDFASLEEAEASVKSWKACDESAYRIGRKQARIVEV